ncbi:hypothetical protein Q1695_003112 [Nippostrongylus brasiliensis]|nr:hypothetical protein Q1695_003112 [Nippostrongylus brasiliensis]
MAGSESNSMRILADTLCWFSNNDDTNRNTFLTTLNAARNNTALGYIPIANGRGYLPTTSNMNLLEYDCFLEAKAYQQVQGCAKAETDDSVYFVLDATQSGKCDILAEIASVVNQSFYESGLQIDTNPPRFWKAEQAKFAKIANADAGLVGCFQKYCGNDLHISCYFDKGLAINSTDRTKATVIYAPGAKALCDATEGSSADSAGGNTGLCIPNNKICPNITGSSNDYMRNYFLNQHNQYRSSIAQGNVYNKVTGTNVRQASRMSRMTYSCTLEQNAYDWARQCINKKSPGSDRYENIYVHNDRSLARREVARLAMERWWRQITNNGLPANHIFVDKKGTNMLSKIIYDEGRRVGCSVVKCSTFTIAVCRYDPAGPAFNTQYYLLGAACNRCDGRPCSAGLCG